MTKKTFLKRLETKLLDLEESKKSEILKKYEIIIDEEVKAGKVEKDVVAALGDIDLIAKIHIRELDKISDSENAQEKEKFVDNKNKSPIIKGIDYIINFFDDVFEQIDEKLAKRILQLFCYIAIGIAIVSLLHIPFKLTTVIGNGIFRVALDDIYLYGIVSTLWTICLNTCYLVLIIWLIIHYINGIISKYDGKNFTNEKKNKKTAESGNNNDKIKQEVKTNSKNDIYDIVYLILKIFIVILTLPFLTIVAGLFILLLFLLSMVFNGVVMIGPILLIIGALIMIVSLLDLIYTSLFKGGVN